MIKKSRWNSIYKNKINQIIAYDKIISRIYKLYIHNKTIFTIFKIYGVTKIIKTDNCAKTLDCSMSNCKLAMCTRRRKLR